MLDFDFIKKNEPISVVGHVNGDLDSFVSCFLMSKYLSFHGISNEVKMLDNHIDEYLDCIGLDVSKIKRGISQSDTLFIVDSSFKFPNKIVGCIDHHPDTPNTDINYFYKKSTSCAKIIYDLMKEEGYEFSIEELKMVCLSLFMDSCSFKSSKACIEDKLWVEDIIKEYGFNYDWFFDKGLCLNDLSNPEEFCFYGTKQYKKNNIPFFSSYIQVKENTSEDFDMMCIDIIREKMKLENISLWVFLVQNVYSDNTKYILIEEDSYVIHYKIFTEEDKKLLSRGNDVIPRVICETMTLPNLFFTNFGYSDIVKNLIDNDISISTMESCTSGLIASTITDTEGASKILKGAFVTYSNEAKIKQGVDSDIIDKYGVYSYETALEMAKNCSLVYNSKIGIGITGTTGNLDENNLDSVQGEIYFCIKINNSNYLTKLSLNTTGLSRHVIKDAIIKYVFSYLGTLLKYPY